MGFHADAYRDRIRKWKEGRGKPRTRPQRVYDAIRLVLRAHPSPNELAAKYQGEVSAEILASWPTEYEPIEEHVNLWSRAYKLADVITQAAEKKREALFSGFEGDPLKLVGFDADHPLDPLQFARIIDLVGWIEYFRINKKRPYEKTMGGELAAIAMAHGLGGPTLDYLRKLVLEDTRDSDARIRLFGLAKRFRTFDGEYSFQAGQELATQLRSQEPILQLDALFLAYDWACEKWFTNNQPNAASIVETLVANVEAGGLLADINAIVLAEFVRTKNTHGPAYRLSGDQELRLIARMGEVSDERSQATLVTIIGKHHSISTYSGDAKRWWEKTNLFYEYALVADGSYSRRFVLKPTFINIAEGPFRTALASTLWNMFCQSNTSSLKTACMGALIRQNYWSDQFSSLIEEVVFDLRISQEVRDMYLVALAHNVSHPDQITFFFSLLECGDGYLETRATLAIVGAGDDEVLIKAWSRMKNKEGSERRPFLHALYTRSLFQNAFGLWIKTPWWTVKTGFFDNLIVVWKAFDTHIHGR